MSASTHDYADCIADWKINLAQARMQAFRIPRHDWPDVLQQLVLAMLKFRYRPEKANGARESTALYLLLNRRLTSILRTETRYRDRLVRHRDALGLTPENADGHPLFLYEDHSDLRMDVRAAIAGLSPRHQAVCASLAQGHTAGQIAAAMGCSVYAVRRLIAGLRVHFKQLGLNQWIRP